MQFNTGKEKQMPEPIIDDKAPIFDPKSFMADLTAMFDTKLNGAINTLDKKIDAIKKMAVPDKKEEIVVPPIVKKDEVPEPKTIAEMNAKLAEAHQKLEALTKDVTTERDLRTTAEKASLESTRKQSFLEALTGMEFSSTKAKTQFQSIYLPMVERAEDGSLFMKNEKGEPVEMASFIKSEYEASPHFQPAVIRGGAGVKPSTNGSGGKIFNYDPNMTPAAIAALSPQDKAAYRAELTSALSQQ